jgi:predicted dehydrogenase
MNEAARPISFAIVGCGLIGRKRAAAVRNQPNAVLSVACDSAILRAQELADSSPGAVAVGDAMNAVGFPGIDAVIVATQNSSLFPIAMEAARAGKHVLIEKPGALKSAELRELMGAASAAGSRIRIGYNHRFHPGIRKAREIFESGVLGPLMFSRGRYGHGGRKGYDREWRSDPKLSGGGELIDQGVHLIDLASWFMGDFPTVEGHAATYFWDMKVDDNAFLSLRTVGGQTAWLHVSCTEWKNLFSLEIYGRDGKVTVDGLGGSYGVEKVAYHRMLPEMGPPESTFWEYPGGDESWALELGAFVDDIVNGREPTPGLREGIRTLEIIESIYAKSGFPKP